MALTEASECYSSPSVSVPTKIKTSTISAVLLDYLTMTMIIIVITDTVPVTIGTYYYCPFSSDTSPCTYT